VITVPGVPQLAVAIQKRRIGTGGSACACASLYNSSSWVEQSGIVMHTPVGTYQIVGRVVDDGAVVSKTTATTMVVTNAVAKVASDANSSSNSKSSSPVEVRRCRTGSRLE
jgi:hypothetical protein